MKHLCLLALASCAAAQAATGGDTRPEPVNVVVETGQDVGACPDGGTLGYPAQAYKGTSYFLLKADPVLASRHMKATQRQAPWLQRLDGPSGANRLYTGADGTQVVVFSVCKPAACSSSSAYGAYAVPTQAYAIELQESGKPGTVLGTETPPLQAAIACTRSIDQRVREAAVQAARVPAHP